MYKLSFFTPETHLQSVTQACFKAGGGTLGSYEQCAWYTLGTGQYKPTKTSNPYQGHAGILETCCEYKVEMIVQDEAIKSVIEALLKTHPYEQPAYGAYKLLTIDDFI